MRINRPRLIGRDTAERLLDGRPLGPDAGYDALSELLSAVAAPAAEGELAGESAAVAAFREAHLGSVRQPRRGPMITTRRAGSLGAKAIAAVFATTALCGVAVAASTGHLPGTRHDGSVASPSPRSTTTAARAGHAGSGPASLPAPGTTPTARPGIVGLCRAYSAAGKTDRGRMLASPPFTGLVRQAGGTGKVIAYCATVLRDKPQDGGVKKTTAPSRIPAARQTDGPGLGNGHGRGSANGSAEGSTSTGTAPEQAHGNAGSGHASGSG
jgi:hypothetical protein